MKTETITMQVKVRITYDDTHEGAREHAVELTGEALSQEVGAYGSWKDGYSAEMLAEPVEVPNV